MQLNSRKQDGEPGSLAFGIAALDSDFQQLRTCFDGRIHLENFRLGRAGDRWTVRLHARVDRMAAQLRQVPHGGTELVVGVGHVTCSCNWYQGGRLLHQRLRRALVDAVADLVVNCGLGVSACFR